MEVLNNIETSVANHFIKDNILYIVFKEGADVSIEDMEESKQARLSLQQNRNMKVLVDSRGLYHITEEARVYAAQDENAQLSIAMAIVSNSLPIKILTNFFIKFNKPNTPTKMFTDIDTAENWLNSINS